MGALYVKPIGLVYGSDANEAFGAGVAGRLGGSHAAGFTNLEVIERDGGKVSTSVRAYADLAASGDNTIAGWLDRIERPRAPVAGLDPARLIVMGIVNVTPDSFSDGGEHGDTGDAIAHGRALVEAGADILDIGGESTRPGSDPVSLDDELARVLPVLEALKPLGVPMSVDTRKAEVMRRSVASGAMIVNDVSSLTHDPDALDAAAALDCPVVLMHSLGEPKTMQQDPSYAHVLLDVYDTLEGHILRAEEAGLPRARLIADPGIGFGKTFDHNLQLLNGLALFHGLGVPLLLGVSRKAFIGAITGETVARRRVPGSISAALAGIFQGAQIVRVHDVSETVQALTVWRRIVDARLN
ncbi:dihydropteroate synthase [Kaustia mangrovi]|uniref:dihydropteroate synthase n=1 Tax=Kaustia mangrovi TaxID=2593653 RepID=A0A7S8C5V5_9HYPH|nr:dihydropteroate synthase [Kaustia mangrovi]QPC43952.1 dihydropteroate synthase [Kaustia mangrovi]